MPPKRSKLVAAHEELRRLVLSDGNLTISHLEEVKKMLSPDLKTIFSNIYEPVCKSDRLEVRRLEDNNVGVVAKRQIVANGDLTLLDELKGHVSSKVTGDVNLDLPKYKSLREVSTTYERNGTIITAEYYCYLVGAIAFVNHSCATHLNCITVSETEYSELYVVQTINKDTEITNDYGYKNNHCKQCGLLKK